MSVDYLAETDSMIEQSPHINVGYVRWTRRDSAALDSLILAQRRESDKIDPIASADLDLASWLRASEAEDDKTCRRCDVPILPRPRGRLANGERHTAPEGYVYAEGYRICRDCYRAEKRPAKSYRLPDETVEAIRVLALEGVLTNVEIGRRVGCSRMAVFKVRERLGLPRSPLAKMHGKPAAIERDTVIELLEAGKSVPEIAEAVGRHPSSVYSAIRRHNREKRSA